MPGSVNSLYWGWSSTFNRKSWWVYGFMTIPYHREQVGLPAPILAYELIHPQKINWVVFHFHPHQKTTKNPRVNWLVTAQSCWCLYSTWWFELPTIRFHRIDHIIWDEFSGSTKIPLDFRGRRLNTSAFRVGRGKICKKHLSSESHLRLFDAKNLQQKAALRGSKILSRYFAGV